MNLSRDEIERFNRDGYLGPLTLVEPPVAVDICRRVQEDVLTHRCHVYAHTSGDFPKVDYTRDRHLDSPMLYRLAASPSIVDRVSSLLGPDLLLWRSDIFAQGPDDPPTYPHQDSDLSGTRVIPCIDAGPNTPPVAVIRRGGQEVRVPPCVSAWIALTPMRPEVGTLWIVPGTHTSFIAQVPGTGAFGRKLVMERTFTAADGVTLEMQPGQFILFHNFLVHGSLPTQEGSRLAWTTRYVTPDTRIYSHGPINAQGQDLSRFGSILVAGHDRVNANVLVAPPPTGLGSILEEASIAAHSC